LNNSPDIEKALSFINKNYDQELQIAALAENLGVSYHHLCRKFKKERGATIGSYIAQLRIERAKELLERSSYSVAEVGKRCGYQSTVQFHRMFERLVEDTPMQYRKKAFSL